MASVTALLLLLLLCFVIADVRLKKLGRQNMQRTSYSYRKLETVAVLSLLSSRGEGNVSNEVQQRYEFMYAHVYAGYNVRVSYCLESQSLFHLIWLCKAAVQVFVSSSCEIVSVLHNLTASARLSLDDVLNVVLDLLGASCSLKCCMCVVRPVF